LNSIRKICVITGTRADFGQLSLLIKHFDSDPVFDLQIVATGMHLSPEFGMTIREVEGFGLKVDYKIETLISGDTPSSISKSTGLGLVGFADAYKVLTPDLVVVLGDRFEIFAACAAALFSRIPIVHIHGGETTVGAFDEAIRHSITKMSTLHFVSAEPYRNRVIQLGEHPDRVFSVGALGVENIRRMELLSKDALEESLNFEFGEKNLLVTFHPVTLEDHTAVEQFNELLKSLKQLKNTKVIFTKANADSDGRVINQLIDEYVSLNPENSIAFKSMGQQNYLSAMKFVDGVIGNSSSGISEAPTFKIGTINIGDRQKGRIMPESVINCKPDCNSITNAFMYLYSNVFKELLASVINPFDGGNTSEKIVQKIKNYEISDSLKKEFYDL